MFSGLASKPKHYWPPHSPSTAHVGPPGSFCAPVQSQSVSYPISCVLQALIVSPTQRRRQPQKTSTGLGLIPVTLCGRCLY